MTQPEPAAGADITINAAPDAVYALITDLPTLASLGEEVATMEWRKGDTAAPGAVFKGHNRNGSKQWSTTCTVTDADPGRVFAFDVRHTVLPIAHWRYDIEPADGGCRVTEREYIGEGEEWVNWWSQTIVRDDKVAFFMRTMPKGRQILTYTMRAEQPGAGSALPTSISNMYDPGQYSSAAETLLRIDR